MQGLALLTSTPLSCLKEAGSLLSKCLSWQRAKETEENVANVARGGEKKKKKRAAKQRTGHVCSCERVPGRQPGLGRVYRPKPGLPVALCQWQRVKLSPLQDDEMQTMV